MQFTPAEISDISVSDKKLKARRYAKRVDKNDTATFQIGLNDNYGLTILVELQGVK